MEDDSESIYFTVILFSRRYHLFANKIILEVYNLTVVIFVVFFNNLSINMKSISDDIFDYYDCSMNRRSKVHVLGFTQCYVEKHCWNSFETFLFGFYSL